MYIYIYIRGKEELGRGQMRGKHIETRTEERQAQRGEHRETSTSYDVRTCRHRSRSGHKWRHLATSRQVATPRHMSPHVPNLSRERGKRNSTRRAQRRAQRQAHIRVCADRSTPTDIPKCKRGRMMVSVRGGGWRRTKHVMRLGKHIETITEAST